MSNYIDADKLIAEIDNIYSEAVCEYKSTKSRYSEGALDVTHRISSIITSLRQEQPKFKTGDTIHKIGENTVFPMTIERIYDGDYVCVTEHQQLFINIKFQNDYELVEQEQPEVDLMDTRIQYASVHDGIKSFAETYSFNIDSQLFPQLSKEQQELWRKEIEQAAVSGGDIGITLARDVRYKENQSQPEVGLEKEIDKWFDMIGDSWDDAEWSTNDIRSTARHFYELGLNARKEE